MYNEREYLKILKWVADDCKVQVDIGNWTTCSTEGVLRHILNGFPADKFRLTPHTIFVNGVDMAAPEKVAPKVGVTYYIPDFGERLQYFGHTWDGDVLDLCYLDRGVVYLNKEDAIARAKAMLLTSDKEGS